MQKEIGKKKADISPCMEKFHERVNTMEFTKKDWVIRALKTFWQAALSALLISLPEIINLIPLGWVAVKPVLLSAGIGALAAGLSAFYNGLIKPHLEVKDTKAEE